MPTRRTILAGLALTVAAAAARPVWAQNPPTAAVRIGVLKYGAVAWELDAMRRAGYDAAAGIALHIVELAGGQATQVALQAGAVDVIVSDWLWVAERRRQGDDFVFAPFSCALGALLTPARSSLTSLADLKGRRIGVAGTPLDKSWLLLKAYARDVAGVDLERQAAPAFAAPALLNEKLTSGEFDAILNFWPFAARAEADGARVLLDMQNLTAHYAGVSGAPIVGYVFRQAWAAANPAAARGFYAATLRTKALLAADDTAWEALRPLMNAENEQIFRLLRDRCREGRPLRWSAVERAGAARMYRLLSADGATEPPPGVFWDGADF